MPEARYDMIPPEVLKEVALVFTQGCKKYNSESIEGLLEESSGVKDRKYYNSGIGHREEARVGITKDHDSRLHPLAHSIACDIILLYRIMKREKLETHGAITSETILKAKEKTDNSTE